MDLDYLKKYKSIIGVDEVGRGPIAGPVCACAVKISDPDLILELQDLNITDSKKLNLKKRNEILNALNINIHELELDKVYNTHLKHYQLSFVISEMDHLQIDKMNILQASLLAMKTSTDSLTDAETFILIDGNKTFESSSPLEAVIKGDSKFTSIALASIIAKNFRDEKMAKYAIQYPGYSFEKHAGYPTKNHKQAVRELGPSPIHRRTFKSVKEFC
ncbi:MAG: ribonuclease HII [Halobacteriovoraceae bacterium]|nr:ribonuclease HII [Halobacteriovoraceae bacterium]|tara:strand:- start:6057 stop:6707 length:651 start_codon:yes stop_codon:yes gene_type:complete